MRSFGFVSPFFTQNNKNIAAEELNGALMGPRTSALYVLDDAPVPVRLARGEAALTHRKSYP